MLLLFAAASPTALLGTRPGLACSSAPPVARSAPPFLRSDPPHAAPLARLPQEDALPQSKRRRLQRAAAWVRRGLSDGVADILAVALTRRRVRDGPPAAAAGAAPQRQVARYWAPSREQVARRHRIIRKLVWMDAEGQLQRFVRSLEGRWERGAERLAAEPWTAAEVLTEAVQQVQGQLARSLKPRDPLIQWHLKTLDPQQPQGAFDECVLVHGRESCAARYAELREALRSVIPCFVALISEAVRRRPARPRTPHLRAAAARRRRARFVASSASPLTAAASRWMGRAIQSRAPASTSRPPPWAKEPLRGRGGTTWWARPSILFPAGLRHAHSSL